MTGILKILVILLILLLLIKRKWDLALVLAVGTVLTALFFGLRPGPFIRNVGIALVSAETIGLVGVILLVLYLGNYLEARGSFKLLVDSLKNLVPEARLILALPPAVIGLLPMLGGALVSAPIVEEAGQRWHLSPSWKTFLNYWFRHVWEYCWPLYLNLILASAILKISIKRIAYFQFPFTILAAGLGLILLFRNVPFLPHERNSYRPSRNLLNLFISLWPILTAIVLIFAFRLSMLLSLALTSALTQVLSSSSLRERWHIFRKSFVPRTVLLVISVMVFKKILEVAGALDAITKVIQPEGISAYILLFAAPFALGLLTGVNHAFVGISFPLLLPVFGAPQPDMILVMFAYISGFAGILLSPAHLCLILTVDFFKAQLKDVYKILLWPVLIIFLAAFMVFLFHVVWLK